jgi:AcrR family transcriptional regulator
MTKAAQAKSRSPRQAQIECSRECIVGAYSKLLASMPDEKITISAICSTAGVGRQTFYRHFKNKKNVFTKRMFDGYELFAEQLRELPRESLTLELILVEAFKFWQAHQTVLNRLAQSRDMNPLLMKNFSLIWRKIAGEFLPVSRAKQYDIEFEIAGIAGVFLHWLNRDMKESPEEVTKIIIALLNERALQRQRVKPVHPGSG